MQLLFPFAKPREPLPPRYKWPRGKQPPDARRQCPQCGRYDYAVSSRGQITYYGPAVCECGHRRGLRKVERPVDYRTLEELYDPDCETDFD